MSVPMLARPPSPSRPARLAAHVGKAERQREEAGPTRCRGAPPPTTRGRAPIGPPLSRRGARVDPCWTEPSNVNPPWPTPSVPRSRSTARAPAACTPSAVRGQRLGRHLGRQAGHLRHRLAEPPRRTRAPRSRTALLARSRRRRSKCHGEGWRLVCPARGGASAHASSHAVCEHEREDERSEPVGTGPHVRLHRRPVAGA